MTCYRFQFITGKKIPLLLMLFLSFGMAFSSTHPNHSAPKPYIQPIVTPFIIPIASRVGFIRSPSQPLTRSEREMLDCYTTIDNQQVCTAKPVSRLLRSR